MTADIFADPWPDKGNRKEATPPPPPRDPNARYIIDPVAFFVALIGGPVLFTLATFWLLLVPVFALAFGGLPYLVIGTPVLLLHLSRNPVEPVDLAGLAFSTITVLALIAFAMAALNGEQQAFGGILFFAIGGAIFGPFWALSFGWLYRLLARDFFTQPIGNF